MGKDFYVTADQAGRRVDRLLRTMWPQVPLGAIMKALRKGDVRLDARKAAPDTRLEEGQFLQVPWDDDVPNPVAAHSAAKGINRLDTVYGDEHVWIVNKPAGLLTQPDVKHGDSLITRALAELKWSRADFSPSTVQRLDRNTSGAVIIALDGVSQRYLSELIRERKIKKIYRAVVLGDIPECGEISIPLLKDSGSNTVRADDRGQSALTIYRKLGGRGGISTVELELVTGRAHQARVHFAEIGHPVAGDAKYGGSFKKAVRQLLHAYSVTFPDDIKLAGSIRGKTFTAPMPDDMKEFFQ